MPARCSRRPGISPRSSAVVLAGHAEVLTTQITNPYQQAQALTRLAEAATTAGDHKRAARLAGHAEVLTTQITNPDQQAEVLTRLAEC